MTPAHNVGNPFGLGLCLGYPTQWSARGRKFSRMLSAPGSSHAGVRGLRPIPPPNLFNRRGMMRASLFDHENEDERHNQPDTLPQFHRLTDREAATHSTAPATPLIRGAITNVLWRISFARGSQQLSASNHGCAVLTDGFVPLLLSPMPFCTQPFGTDFKSH